MTIKERKTKAAITLHKNTIFYVESIQINKNEETLSIQGYAVHNEKYKWVHFEYSTQMVKKSFIFLEQTHHPLGESHDDKCNEFEIFIITIQNYSIQKKTTKTICWYLTW